MSDILVSVYCLAYNHEKYIRKTLDGFVCQQTDFLFEVFIHDDASTDNTAAIISEYAEKYPSVIIPLFEEENQYSKKKSILKQVYPLMHGKYVAICEGDDYWCDCKKLQKQVDWIEHHSECVMVTHMTEKITADGKHISYMMNDCKRGYIDGREFIFKSGKCPHLSSFLVKRELLGDKRPSFFGLVNGDNAIRLYAVSIGKVYFIDEVMSVYRVLVPNSWSDRQRHNTEFRKTTTKNAILFFEQYDEYTSYQFHETIVKEIQDRRFSLFLYEKEYLNAISFIHTISAPVVVKLKLYYSCFCSMIKALIIKEEKK